MDPQLREEVIRLIVALTSDNGAVLSKGLESRVTALEKTSQIHSDTILRITQGLDDANKRISALEQSRDDLVTSVSDAQLAISRLENAVGALQTAVNGLDSSVTQLGSRVGQLETGLAGLRNDYSSLATRMDSAERSIGSLTTELATLTLRVTSIQSDFETRVSVLERTAVTSASAPLAINNNRITMGLNDGLTLSGNNLAIRLPGTTGLNIQNGGLQFRFNTDQFQIVNNNLTLKTTVFDPINSRVSTIEQSYVASAVTPLRLNSSTKVLDMLIDSSTLEINSNGQLAVKSTSPNLRYPIANISGSIGMSPNYRFRQSMWIGLISYSGSGLNWRIQVNSDIFIVDDYIHICLPAFDGFMIADGGDLSLNFVTGLLPPLLTGDTEPAFHTDVVTYGARTISIGLSAGGTPQYISKNLWVEQWQDGVLRLRVEGGGMITHSNSKWPAMTISYPRSFT
uniref:Sigma 1 n=1 Tax=Mammalian orthoreovirus 3 TaxID=538123 RepID=I1Z8A8_9REOV|nr:sigma 1 [Mammalian orthoreovirus 3]AFJ15513.1 sigma 1 [Mammalian orthoreovirus 3]AFJ15515.1 sigma 1 [Mammalian orthoreovirus 3]AFJ15517.1 sigma 1 [Mammalian orthoreovirus 3]AFJ15518.1 sigma 1 [Mammalian orthoreovirus 3]